MHEKRYYYPEANLFELFEILSITKAFKANKDLEISPFDIIKEQIKSRLRVMIRDVWLKELSETKLVNNLQKEGLKSTDLKLCRRYALQELKKDSIEKKVFTLAGKIKRLIPEID
jgi:hypothetical protein